MDEIGIVEERFAILEHIPVGICVIREDYTVLFWNNCLEDWTGVKKSEIVGGLLWRRFPELNAPKYRRRLETIFDGGPPAIFSAQLHKYIFPARRQNGEMRIQHTTVSGAPAVDRNRRYALFAVEDVTELTHRIRSYWNMRNQALAEVKQRVKVETEKVRLEEQLFQSHKMESLGAMASGITHDFNNMLTSIITNADMALTNVEKGSLAHECMEDVLSVSRKARELVDQLLSFSRQSRLEARPVVMHYLIRDALKMVRSTIPDNIRVKENLGASTGKIMADPTRIYQVIINLCTNARQAMAENGGVLEIGLDEVDIDPETISAGEGSGPNRGLRMTVKDTGIGMSPEERRHIFEPFFTTRKAGEGTGLGLAVVHRIIEDHGGRIRVWSEKNVGTTFEIDLPGISDPVEKGR